MKRFISFWIFVFVCVNLSALNKIKIIVGNKISVERLEMAEVDFIPIKTKLGTDKIFITDADGREIPSQRTYNDKLIFRVGVPSKGKSIYYAVAGENRKYEPQVFGCQFPEYNNDVTWENDCVAFRCSGSDSLKNGDSASGYDVWNKRTSKLVVKERYKNEFDKNILATIQRLRTLGYGDLADDVYNSVSYYVDHGNGMDCYSVGKSLGCGTSTLLNIDDKSIIYPHAYKNCVVLDNGPLRFTVKLSYEIELQENVRVIETRLISLDAGSHMNRVDVSYDRMLPSVLPSVGIVIHNENPYAYLTNIKNGYMIYDDLGDFNLYKEKYRSKQNQDLGHTYIGVVFPTEINDMQFITCNGLQGALGHLMGIIGSKSSFSYYFGTAWNRNASTNIISMDDAEAYFNSFAKRIKSPLTITFN